MSKFIILVTDNINVVEVHEADTKADRDGRIKGLRGQYRRHKVNWWTPSSLKVVRDKLDWSRVGGKEVADELCT